jgi:hypothetical protein
MLKTTIPAAVSGKAGPEVVMTSEATVIELCSGSYEQAAHVTGAEEYRAALPFPVTLTPRRS